jgi:hypothetical protein
MEPSGAGIAPFEEPLARFVAVITWWDAAIPRGVALLRGYAAVVPR